MRHGARAFACGVLPPLSSRVPVKGVNDSLLRQILWVASDAPESAGPAFGAARLVKSFHFGDLVIDIHYRFPGIGSSATLFLRR